MKATAWKIGYEKGGEKGPYLIVDSQDSQMVVAKIPTTLARDDREDIADLIAGAPEMYETCSAIVAAHDEKFADAPIPHCFCDDVCLPILYALDLCNGTMRREAVEATRERKNKRARERRRAKK